MKIIDKIEEQIRENNLPFYSFEFFPPKTDAGMLNLQERIERMVFNLRPLFVDVTWGAGGSTSEATLELAGWIQKYSGTEVMMHLTCTNMTLEVLNHALDKAKELGIQNILALRGDPPKGQERWSALEGGFKYASDLVKYIRQKYGNYFSIGVAGYSEGHPDSPDKQTDVQNLKIKVDAGADFIITQLFYDVDEFLDYIDRCRAAGITVPIIPGIMPIQNYQGWARMTSFCNTKIPQKIIDRIEPIKADDEKVKDYGIELAIDMCKQLTERGVKGLHFYTLNLERSVWRILEGLEIIRLERVTPWRYSAVRGDEEVRPAFWKKRPKSYIARTSDWDEFPNGRWGDSRSPAFGIMYPQGSKPMLTENKKENLMIEWGEPKSLEDISEVFVRYLNGDINNFPWYEEGLTSEVNMIKEFLVKMNEHGLLTLSSQPQVNGMKSSDPVFGWGPTNGYIYQRAFVEFFCPMEYIDIVLDEFRKNPSISYQATRKTGEITRNIPEDTVIAVTWGIFPNREVIQPTIVDTVSFKAWRDEAFSVWTNEWARIYDSASESYRLLNSIADNFYLVNVVENDFVDGNLENVFLEIFRKLKTQGNSIN